jgi:hypothetical protein
MARPCAGRRYACSLVSRSPLALTGRQDNGLAQIGASADGSTNTAVGVRFPADRAS